MTGWIANFYDWRSPINGVYFINKKQLELLNVNEKDKILDIGCGTATILKSLHNKYTDKIELYGIDPSEDMIRVAKSKFSNAENVHLKIGIGEELPYQDNKFDWIFSSLTFHHIPLEGKKKTLKEAYRVLKSGGKLLIADFGKPISIVGKIISSKSLLLKHAFVKENIKGIIPELIQEAGFKNLEIQAIQGGVIYHLLAVK